jgi:hypothetical protein
MLKSIDLLISFTVVILVVSMAVTMITQLIVNMLNLRGVALRRGVTELLVLIDKGVLRTDAQAISDHILRDPLVGQPALLGRYRRLASVIQREELTKLLLTFGRDPTLYPENQHTASETAAGLRKLQMTFRTSLQSNGVDDPNQALAQIRLAALSLEKTNPELSNDMRANVAMLNFAASEFLGKLYGWFDQTMDRVGDHFTGITRLATVGAAAGVAMLLQLDTVGIINRLSSDDVLRNQLVQYAIKQDSAPDSVEAKPRAAGASSNSAPMAVARAPGSSPPPSAPPSAKGTHDAKVPATAPARPASEPAAVTVGPSGSATAPSNEASADLNAARKIINDSSLIPLPDWPHWIDSWRNPSLDIGVLLSAILLSLGAPFWFAMLKNLLQLRSALAFKDDSARATRQTAQRPGASSVGPTSPYIGDGEIGDLNAVG